jgi:phospholipid transport system substrate-binding protein
MRVVSVIFLSFFVFAGVVAPASAENPAAQRIEKLGQEVLAVLADPSISKNQRAAHFSGLIARDLDIPVIGKFVLGKHWRKASVEQRKAFIRVFKRYVIHTYSSRLGGAKLKGFKVLGVKNVGKRDILVKTRLSKQDGGIILADWRMRERKGKYKILDLFVEGVSMSMTLRQEFNAVLRDKNGIDGLIMVLNSRAT